MNRCCIIVMTITLATVQNALAIGDFGPDTCMDGFVWREACPGDHVCVVPGTRDQARQDNAAAASRVQPGGGPFGPDTCRQGFVWREACGPNDHVCVSTQVRGTAAQDNQQAGQRKKYPFCQDYAQDAIVTAAAAATFGCGFSGPRWNATAEQHFQWCLSVLPDFANSERAGRGTELVACQQR